MLAPAVALTVAVWWRGCVFEPGAHVRLLPLALLLPPESPPTSWLVAALLVWLVSGTLAAVSAVSVVTAVLVLLVRAAEGRQGCVWEALLSGEEVHAASVAPGSVLLLCTTAGPAPPSLAAAAWNTPVLPGRASRGLAALLGDVTQEWGGMDEVLDAVAAEEAEPVDDAGEGGACICASSSWLVVLLLHVCGPVSVLVLLVAAVVCVVACLCVLDAVCGVCDVCDVCDVCGAATGAFAFASVPPWKTSNGDGDGREVRRCFPSDARRLAAKNSSTESFRFALVGCCALRLVGLSLHSLALVRRCLVLPHLHLVPGLVVVTLLRLVLVLGRTDALPLRCCFLPRTAISWLDELRRSVSACLILWRALFIMLVVLASS